MTLKSNNDLWKEKLKSSSRENNVHNLSKEFYILILIERQFSVIRLYDALYWLRCIIFISRSKGDLN